MKLQFDQVGYNPDAPDGSETTTETRPISVSKEGYGVRIGLGRNGVEPESAEAPDVYIEWKPGKGWMVYCHVDDNDPLFKASLYDDGGFVVERWRKDEEVTPRE